MPSHLKLINLMACGFVTVYWDLSHGQEQAGQLGRLKGKRQSQPSIPSTRGRFLIGLDGGV